MLPIVADRRSPPESSSSVERWFPRLSVALCGYALVGGALSFLGWAADMPWLTDWDGDGISIQPNAALTVILASSSLLLLLRGFRRATFVTGAMVAGIAGATLFEYVTGLNLGIDDVLMFGREWGRVGVLVPGRMGPPGTVSWLLIGSALVMASSRQERLRMVAPIPVLGSAFIASLSLIGYLYGASLLYTIPTLTVIAFQTSTFVLAISAAIVLTAEGHGPMRLLADRGPAGTLVRRILPGIIVLPVLLGFIRLVGEKAGLYDLAFGTAARTLAEIVLFSALLWWTARAVDRHSKAHAQAEAALSAREGELRDAEVALQRSRDALETDFADSRALQELSAALIDQNDVDELYRRVLDTARQLARSPFASLQIVVSDPATGNPQGLRLLAEHGFTARARTFWEWVNADSRCAGGMAVLTGARVEIPDVLASEAMAGSEDLQVASDTGIRAVQTTPLISREGKILGMLSTYWSEPHTCSDRERRLIDILVRQAADLIERRQQEEALREADRRKDVFLMTLAHELRNPLAPIRSAAGVLTNALSSQPGLARVRDILERQTSVMSRLLDDLLDVGRIAQDRLELRSDRVSLQAVLRSAVEMSSPLVERFGHQLELTLPEVPIEVLGDEVRLAQVVGNLLNNACRYTAPGGRVSLRLERHGEEAVITLTDSGIGIARDKLSTIFELFSQVDTSLERTQGGLGIGLHLVKRLVDLHSGRIHVHSAGVGQGSTFTVSLPLLELSDVPDVPAHVPAAGPSASARRTRVLVVDDNADAAEMLSTLLEFGNHETAVANDGATALTLAESFRPDVVLLDIGLPQLNGYAVCQELRSKSWDRRITLIAVTGWGQDSDRIRSREAGFDYHLVKPIDHAALLKLLAETPARLLDV
jgi:signal transduction histidine kinase